MVQQMSGGRADGRAWPPAGVVFEVDAEEARFLTRVTDSQPMPIATLVEEKRTETADKPAETPEPPVHKAAEPPKAETRVPDVPEAPVETRPAPAPEAPRRGRPPGSTNRPK
jgi:hypothetical protein